LPLAESLTLNGIVPDKLLRAPSHLRLKRQVSRALNRSEEPRQILLLRLDECYTLLLETQRIVQKSAHVLLVGLISGGHLHSELSSRFALPRHELILLRREPRVGLSQLRELRVGEAQLLLRYLGRLLAEALLQRRTIRVSGTGRRLSIERSRDEKQRESGKA
jgi:hypothetical protein